MTSFNPFKRSDSRHGKFEEAWDLKSRGDVYSALEGFREILESCPESSLKYVQTLHPMAVCYRIAGQTENAERAFRKAYDLAQVQARVIIELSILLDWTALMLDQKRPRDAAKKLEDTIGRLPRGDAMLYAKAMAYLGRVEGHIRGKRRQGRLRQDWAASVLRGRLGFEDMHLDNLIWMLELWFWSPRGRLKCAFEARRLARQLGYPMRVVDVWVTFIGGRPARRGLLGLYRLKQKLMGR